MYSTEFKLWNEQEISPIGRLKDGSPISYADNRLNNTQRLQNCDSQPKVAQEPLRELKNLRMY